MLDLNKLNEDATLKALPDDVKKAIATLSKNDEVEVIGQERKTWWDKLDEDVREVFGVDKLGGQKSHEHHKKMLLQVKADAEAGAKVSEYTAKITQLEKEKTSLEKKIADGSGDEALKASLSKLEKQLKDKTDELDGVKTTYEKEKTELSTKLETMNQKAARLEFSDSLQKHLVESKVQFKKDIPGDILPEILDTRRQKFLAKYKTDEIDDGSGNKVTVLRNADGTIMRNAEKGLSPYTPGELFLKDNADLVAIGQQAAGGGGGAGGAGGGGTAINLSTAKTQQEADEIIVSHMMKVEGLTKFDPKWQDRQLELRKEYEVGKLPHQV